jgi:heme-degrading monooxygenase HmoA
MFVILWTYDVRPGAEAAFEKVYGPSGEWVALFQQAEGYLGTELLCAAGASLRYLTIDRWESEAAYNRFRTKYAREYEMVDRVGERLTEAETPLGQFRK